MFGMAVGLLFDQKLSYFRIQPNRETKANIFKEQHKAIYSFNTVSKDKLSGPFFFLGKRQLYHGPFVQFE